MAEFNKVKALDEIMEIFKLGPNPMFFYVFVFNY